MNQVPAQPIFPDSIPWEDPSLGPLARYARTLMGAFHPFRTAYAFRGKALGAPWKFALLTLLPLLLLRGVIPFTSTMFFKGGMGFELQANVTMAMVVADVAQAMLLSLAIGGAFFAAIWFPYLSLAQAYGQDPDAAFTARRFLLYRGWMLALSFQGLPMQLVMWFFANPELSSGARLIFEMLDLIPMLLFVQGMQISLKLSCGLRALPAFATTLIPLVLAILLTGTCLQLLPIEWLAPPVPSEAATAAMVSCRLVPIA